MKKVLAMLLACIVTISLTACGSTNTGINTEGDNQPTSKQAEMTSVSEEDMFVVTNEVREGSSPVEYDAKKPAEVAKAFIRSLASGDYKTVISILNISESPFVLSEDIEFAIPKSKYSSILDLNEKKVYLVVNEENINKTDNGINVVVSIMSENKMLNNYNVSLTKEMNGTYMVNADAFYLKDYYISVPGDTKLLINDMEVPEKYIDSPCGHNDLKNLYLIPYIGKETKEIKVVSNNFTETKKVLPVATTKEKPFIIVKNLENIELDEALTAVKDLWNNLYNDFSNGASIEDIGKYFAENVDTQVYADIFDCFEKIRKGSGGYKDINHQITTIEKRADAECFYITDDVIVMNFQYQVDWKWDFSLGGPESGRRMNHVLIQKTSDGYKIYEVRAIDLFGDVSGKEW